MSYYVPASYIQGFTSISVKPVNK